MITRNSFPPLLPTQEFSLRQHRQAFRLAWRRAQGIQFILGKDFIHSMLLFMRRIYVYAGEVTKRSQEKKDGMSHLRIEIVLVSLMSLLFCMRIREE